MPDSYQELLAHARLVAGKGLRSRVNWVQKGRWHLTLKFLGDSTQEQLDQLVSELEQIVPVPFVFQAGGAGVFPAPKSSGKLCPRVLWVGIRKGEEQVRSLAAAVESAAVNASYAPEKRGFSPHLTLARVKNPETDPWEEVLASLRALSWPESVMDRFVLWKSVLGPGGPSYTVLHEFSASA